MKALKANKMFTIGEQEKKAYLEEGYTILDDNEKVIEAPAKDLDLVGKELSEARATIEKKDKEIAELNARLVELDKENRELKEAAGNTDEDKEPTKKTTKK